jgi:hypothetical protein
MAQYSNNTNANDNFVRVYNTTVSGSSIISSLTNDDMRSIQFAGALAQAPPLVLATPGPTPPSADQWVQATVSSLGLNTPAGVSGVDLGPDTATGAAKLRELLNLRNQEDRRLLRFHQNTWAAQNINLQNTAGATDTWIKVLYDGTASSGSKPLYNGTSGNGSQVAGNTGPGRTRLVEVSGTGSVSFNILTQSI